MPAKQSFFRMCSERAPIATSFAVSMAILGAIFWLLTAVTPIETAVRAADITAADTTAADTTASSRPVLVELFTSEGCSSCPPADALLAQLDQTQFVPGAQAIVLSEHVTYWNSLGWRDPYSADTFTARQNQYGTRLGLSGVYTPQAVVDGIEELVGSDRGKLTRAIRNASAKPKIPISLDNLHWSGDTLDAQITTADTPKGTSLFAALADESDRSSVLHGENEGRDLRHVAVVRTLTQIKSVHGALNEENLQIKPPSGSAHSAKMRLVVFLVDSRSGQVLGVTMKAIPS